jgi:NAD(P)-dependent dehydrogenase (short-subunit alcohol dehydrogenase family)
MVYTIDLSGKTAVVTGATGTLFSAVSRALAQAGANVALLATTEEKTRTLATDINLGRGGKAVGFAVDVVQRDSLQVVSEKIMAEFGRVDILINGAGGNSPQALATATQSFFDLPEEALRSVLDLNLLGSLFPAQVFGKIMAEQGEGVILNVSSMATYRAITRVIAYGAAKTAINNFTQWLAVYFAHNFSPNIRVNAIAPGFFIANQNRALLIDEQTGALTERGQKIIDHTPMKRFGQADDLVGTVLWLVSDASRFVTGIVVPVDGGFNVYSGV